MLQCTTQYVLSLRTTPKELMTDIQLAELRLLLSIQNYFNHYLCWG